MSSSIEMLEGTVTNWGAGKEKTEDVWKELAHRKSGISGTLTVVTPTLPA